MRSLLLVSGIVLTGAGLTTRALDLYNGSLNTSPAQQGWLMYGADVFTIVPPGTLVPVDFSSTAGGKTSLDTAANQSYRAGFSNYDALTGQFVNPAFPTLDRSTGFDLRIENLMLASESHSRPDRAGFSVIAISSGPDNKGIEIGFHGDEVFAQVDSPLFTGMGETAAIDMSQPRNLDLLIRAAGYELWLDGEATPLLSGPLRDYSAFVATPPWPNPYVLPGHLFFGDDTQSAGARVEFSRISVTSVPEPASAAFLAIVGASLLGLRWRARQC